MAALVPYLGPGVFKLYDDRLGGWDDFKRARAPGMWLLEHEKKEAGKNKKTQKKRGQKSQQ